MCYVCYMPEIMVYNGPGLSTGFQRFLLSTSFWQYVVNFPRYLLLWLYDLSIDDRIILWQFTSDVIVIIALRYVNSVHSNSDSLEEMSCGLYPLSP